MDLSAVVCTVLAAVAALVLLAGGYLRLYARVINRALDPNGPRPRRMIPPHRVAAVLAAVLALLAAAFCLSGADRLTTARDVEESLRQSSAVREDWNVEVALSEELAAALAYDDALSDHSFAVYRNKGTLLTDYRFRTGGHIQSVAQGVSVFQCGGAQALLSMNAPRIARIRSHDGESYEIDPDRPFVLVLPAGDFDAYDSAGKRIDLPQERWYECRELP